ncbi:hypothetical protein [Leptospira sp. GIMC2001]|uniref:hypothetical protein n=1 Tax=Leptospira sp. GIMC2001 TaxID=1513297 RepID=UPI00234B0290|nr:hypothetical protein [Leptospira sp. GIMC2001]WCL48279.1 hypothetical protein O4O04_13300 [Leptospira sp. GIMC2001]
MEFIKTKKRLITAILALLTMLCSVFMLFQYPAQASLSEGYQTPVLAFEFARTPEDLNFMTGDSPDAQANRIAMRLGQSYDSLFPFLYAGLIAMCIFSIAKQFNSIVFFGILFSILIVPSDLYENSIMNAIIDSLDGGQNVTKLLSSLYIATWLKWGNISIAMMILSIVAYLNKDWIPSVFVSAIASIMIFLTWVTGQAIVAEAMMLSVSIFFIYFSVRSMILYYRSKHPQ